MPENKAVCRLRYAITLQQGLRRITLNPMQSTASLLVFSDLDGTLLDHETYGWEPARPAISKLKQAGVPLILASSKTAAEMVPLQRDMGLEGVPAIVENGGGVIGLHTGQDEKALTYADIRRALDDMPRDLRAHFSGFGDMQRDDVSAATGLSQDDAVSAKRRAFSEPGLWSGDDGRRARFLHLLAEQGIAASEGGRFLTLSSGRTKADGMARIIAHYKPACTIALGDAPNDTEMLEAADFGVIVKNPHRSPLPRLAGEDAGRILRTDAPGPAGWNTAVLALIEQIMGSQEDG